MERHPEEDNDHEYEHEGSDTLFGLFFGQLYNLFSMGGGLCCLLLGGYVGMFKGLLETEVDGHGNHEREAGYRESHVV